MSVSELHSHTPLGTASEPPATRHRGGSAGIVYRLRRSPLQGEETVSTTVTCSTCCRGGSGIRERFKHAFLWVRSPAATPNAIVAELADAADLSSAGRFP